MAKFLVNPITGNLDLSLNKAAEIKYDNTTSGLTATNTQAAIDEVEVIASDAIPSSEKGAALGVATLDAGGKVPISQLPSSIMEYKGTWDASTNAPALVDGVGDIGDLYRVSVAGTQNLGSGSIAFQVGDYVIYNGTIWERSPSGSGIPIVEVRTITGGEATAKQLTLANTPTQPATVRVEPFGGILQEYSADYTITGAVLDWDSLGLDTIGVEAGDKFQITYWI